MAIDKITPAGLTTSTNQPNFRNIIINGDMSQSQRSTSVSSITGSGYHTIDRYRSSISSIGTWTQSQSTDVPSGQGFAKSLKMDCTTADASPAAGDALQLQQRVEGQNVQYLKKGTSSAESLTCSFWVKSNKTGTYILEIDDNDNTRNINKSYTISSADTWEKKTITYDGDTTGAFGNDNGISLQLIFWLGAGSNFTSGTLQTSWGSTTNANRAVGQVNLADSTSNEWYVTGVQLEAGTSASDFEFLPFDVNKNRCLRYFYKWVSGHVYNNLCIAMVTGGKTARGVYQTPTIMRSSPSLSADGNFRMVAGGTATGTGSDVTVARNNADTQFINVDFSSGTDSTARQACELGANNDADAEIAFSAEL